MSCEKHPSKYNGYSPKEFSDEFKTWSENYIKKFFEGTIQEYKREGEDDKKNNKMQLSSNLENLATSIYLTNKFIQENDEGKTPVTNPEDLAKGFVYTNYFYQREVFTMIKEDMPQIFETAIKAIKKVCKSCEKHMENPYKK